MHIRITVVTFLCLLFVGCQLDDISRIKIDAGDQVIFKFSGSGRLAVFSVQDIGTNSRPIYNNILWQVEPEQGRFEGRWVFDIDSITYGVVPAGYKQTRPAGEIPVRRLADGKYLAMQETVSAGYRPVFFTIKNGKVLPAESQKN